ncbi:MAG: DUF799 domain-containing protein [Prevotellaceae bacterium]|jgi:hypothetical protein|nr:DUF799 domain-containing protein [Prevotellaceae bacterium]
MRKIFYILLGGSLLVQSCTVSKLTKAEAYSKMYSERPLSIAVMPPINTTTNVEAKEFFYVTLTRTLCEQGYYVVPSFLCLDLYRTESAYDAENYATSPLDKFRTILGADAALFTYITEWKKSTLGSNITVTIEYVLRSTVTNETIFRRKGTITYDTSVQVSGAGLLGAVAGLAASALNTAMSDYVPVARACNAAVLSDMPAGKYSPSYDVDKTLIAGPAEIKQTVK